MSPRKVLRLLNADLSLTLLLGRRRKISSYFQVGVQAQRVPLIHCERVGFPIPRRSCGKTGDSYQVTASAVTQIVSSQNPFRGCNRQPTLPAKNARSKSNPRDDSSAQRQPLKGAVERARLAPSLKRWPDTNPAFAAACQTDPFPDQRYGNVTMPSVARPAHASFLPVPSARA